MRIVASIRHRVGGSALCAGLHIWIVPSPARSEESSAGLGLFILFQVVRDCPGRCSEGPTALLYCLRNGRVFV